MIEEKQIPRLYERQMLAVGVTLFLFIAAWEATTNHEAWSWLGLLPLVLEAYFVEVRLVLPSLSIQLHYYHPILLATFFLLGPPTAVLVAALSLATGLARTWLRFRPEVTVQLLERGPGLVALWLAGKVYLALVPLSPDWFRGLLPVIVGTTLYFLLYVLLKITTTCVMQGAGFDDVFRRDYLAPTLVFLSAAVGAGLLSYFSLRVGDRIYLLVIPLALFVLTTCRIYARNMQEASGRVSELSRRQTSIIETLALAIDAKDHSTHGRARRVQVYALGIAKSLGIDNREDLEALSTAALLNDIGKLAIPEYILSKPGKLTDAEFAKMKSHVEIAANILEPIRFSDGVVPIIRYHHERVNGSGYPYGIKGHEIPLGSKILAVADTFDALTAQRTYRKPLSVPEAIDQIRAESGVCFDVEVVRAFLNVAPALAEEVSALDANRHSDKTRMPQSALGTEYERKQWLQEKGFSEIASTHREIYALHEIFQAVGKSLKLEDTLNIILTKLQSVVPFTTGAVYLKNKKNDMIHPAMVTGEYAEQLHKNWIRMGEGLTGHAIAVNQLVVNSDPAMDFRNLTYLEQPHQLANAMIFPLRDKDSVLGAIALYSDKDKEAFSEDHVRLMETVSERAAVSIQNALSFQYYEENSLTDPLTGLPNSRYMFMVFEQNVKKANRADEKMAVLVMDLNDFKQVNDQYGHKVGDEVLVKVAELLQKEMRRYDTCIRYAGDEFVAFLYNAERETAEKIVERIRKAVHALVLKVSSGNNVRLGISVGLSMYPEDGIELTQLFTVADSQMYNDKFETKAAMAARQAAATLKEAVEIDAEIEFQRAN